MAEPRMVEVVCEYCDGTGRNRWGKTDSEGCNWCLSDGYDQRTLVPNSDAALLMALGEAAMVWLDGGADPEKMRTRFPRVESTAAALRAHREGRGRGAGGGSAAARSRAAALRARLAALTTEEK